MDKKNTLLLTVIAVATLLVAVVGATFAYFSLNISNNSSSTAVRVSTDSVGTVALSNGGEAPHLNLSAADMSQTVAGEQGKTYYSTISGGKDHEDSAIEHTFAKVTVTGGEEDANYKCTATFTITLNNTGGAEFQKGEAALHLTADSEIDLSNLELSTDEIDLSDLTTPKTGTVTFKLTGEGEKTIKGYLYVKNTTEDQTSRLAGKELSVTVAGDSFKCEAVANFD